MRLRGGKSRPLGSRRVLRTGAHGEPTPPSPLKHARRRSQEVRALGFPPRSPEHRAADACLADTAHPAAHMPRKLDAPLLQRSHHCASLLRGDVRAARQGCMTPPSPLGPARRAWDAQVPGPGSSSGHILAADAPPARPASAGPGPREADALTHASRSTSGGASEAPGGGRPARAPGRRSSLLTAISSLRRACRRGVLALRQPP